MVDKEKLDKLAKALDSRAKNFASEEGVRAQGAEAELQNNIDVVEGMFGGKALQYLTQAQYDALSDEEKNDDGVIYYIIDSEDVMVTREMVNRWDAKVEQQEFDEITSMLNGYGLWVGTTEELEAIEERDPNTLYFEIDDGTHDIMPIQPVDGVLALTKDDYQIANIAGDVHLLFPSADAFMQVHLFLEADVNANIVLPECRCNIEPVIEAGKTYEMIATYNTVRWILEVKVYN